MTEPKHLRILYVDDDRDIRHIVKLSLALDSAIDLRSSPGGAETISMLDDDPWRPDVVMLDVMMPRMDGPSLMAALRQRPEFKDVPFIFVTARAREADVRAYHDAGAKAVILKPFHPTTLAADVRALLKEE